MYTLKFTLQNNCRYCQNVGKLICKSAISWAQSANAHPQISVVCKFANRKSASFYDYPQMANPQICVTPVGNAAKEREVNVYTTPSQNSPKSTVISFTKFLFSTNLN